MALQAVRTYRELIAPPPPPQPVGPPRDIWRDESGTGMTAQPGYQSILANVVQIGPGRTPRPEGLEELFAKLLVYWQLTHDQGAALAGYTPQASNKVMRVLTGLSTFDTVDERDRVLQLYALRRMLGGLFRDRDVENRWLRTPNAALDDNSPLNLLLSRSFVNVLRVKQFVEHCAGM